DINTHTLHEALTICLSLRQKNQPKKQQRGKPPRRKRQRNRNRRRPRRRKRRSQRERKRGVRFFLKREVGVRRKPEHPFRLFFLRNNPPGVGLSMQLAVSHIDCRVFQIRKEISRRSEVLAVS